jgi:hypothetical protein
LIILCRLVFVISGCVLGILVYLHSAHSQHLISRITQASAQITTLDKLGSSLHNELLTAVLEPDILTAKAALARFERDAIHSLGVLDRLTVEEIAMISERERAGEENELERPIKLRNAVVDTVAATQRVVNIRQSSDIMPDATSALARLEVERAAITALVSEILEDERKETTTALGNLSEAQRIFAIRFGVLLLVMSMSGLLGLHVSAAGMLHWFKASVRWRLRSLCLQSSLRIGFTLRFKSLPAKLSERFPKEPTLNVNSNNVLLRCNSVLPS